MDFIEYNNVAYSKLSERKTTLLTAEKNTFIKSISVCNKSDEDSGIRINLLHVISLGVIEPLEIHRVEHLLINKNQSIDLIVYLGKDIFLANGQSLLIHSDGYKQLFDCTVDFYEHNEIL